jgi:ATP-binding cassette, subfamily B, bacterial
MTTAADRRDSKRLNQAVWLVLRRYGRQITRRPWISVPALVLPGIGDVLVFYAPPLVVAQLLGTVARDDALTLGMFAPYVLTFTALWFAGEVVWRGAEALIARAEISGIQSLYVEAMDELLAKDLAFFHDNFAGSLTKRTLGYARRFEDVFDVLSFQVIAKILPLGFVTVVLWRYSPLLILVLLGMLSITVALVVPRIRRRRQLVDEREAASNVLAGHVADSIANAEAVRAFARERDEAAIHAANVQAFGKKTLRSWDYQNFRVNIITAPMYVLTNTLGLIVALHISLDTAASLETVFLTFTYFATATRVMWEFNRIYRNLEGALTDAAQFADLLLDPPSVQDVGSPVAFAPRDHSVEVRDISFRHSPAQPLLFDRFSLAVAAGTKLGLVGRSGGGKTTITRLLLRFKDVERGQILVGGQSIADVSQSSLREVIAYVPQDPAMFHRTIADNIRFARPEATDEEVRRAAALAHAAEFVESLPEGYDTLVGERGIKLSGGQRQRIAIARAILKDAPILILDEATSSLDSESEALIQDALWTLMAGRTAIVIAHRLSTVRRMDSLVVLDGGRIVEQGSHENLLALGGIYASLWSHQSGGFLPATDVETTGPADDQEQPIEESRVGRLTVRAPNPRKSRV